MAYTQTTWSSGDVITAEKLNNIEMGIAGNIITINSIDDNAHFDQLLDPNLTLQYFMRAFVLFEPIDDHHILSPVIYMENNSTSNTILFSFFIGDQQYHFAYNADDGSVFNVTSIINAPTT